MESLASQFLAYLNLAPTPLTSFSGNCGAKFGKKLKNLSKPRITRRRSPRRPTAWRARLRCGLRLGRPSQPVTGRVVSSEKLRGIPRTATAMPDERNSNTDAERGQIQHDHTKSKQIHSHRQSDRGVHCQNANQPKESGLLHPNENGIADLDQTD